MNAMLDFICMGPVELLGARNQRKLRNEKFLSPVGFDKLGLPGVCSNPTVDKNVSFCNFAGSVFLAARMVPCKNQAWHSSEVTGA